MALDKEALETAIAGPLYEALDAAMAEIVPNWSTDPYPDSDPEIVLSVQAEPGLRAQADAIAAVVADAVIQHFIDNCEVDGVGGLIS